MPTWAWAVPAAAIILLIVGLAIEVGS